MSIVYKYYLIMAYSLLLYSTQDLSTTVYVEHSSFYSVSKDPILPYRILGDSATV